MIAVQLGESTQVHTGGFLEAIPHCVVRNKKLAGKKVSRNTYALFMEPNHLEVMKIPEGIPIERAQAKAFKIPPLSNRWDNGIFSKIFIIEQ